MTQAVGHYTVALRHAGGSIRIETTATSMRRAIEQVCEFEGAPYSAVISVWYREPVVKEMR